MSLDMLACPDVVCLFCGEPRWDSCPSVSGLACLEGVGADESESGGCRGLGVRAFWRRV